MWPSHILITKDYSLTLPNWILNNPPKIRNHWKTLLKYPINEQEIIREPQLDIKKTFFLYPKTEH